MEAVAEARRRPSAAQKRQRQSTSGTAPGMSQPPWDFHYDPSRPDDFNSPDPASFAFPFHLANPPTPAPTDLATPTNHVSPEYMLSPGAGGGAVFPGSYSAPAHSGAMPAQNMVAAANVVNWGTPSTTPGPVHGQDMFSGFGSSTHWVPQPTAPIASSHAPMQSQGWGNVNIEQPQPVEVTQPRSFVHRLGLGQRFRRPNSREKEVAVPNPQDTSTCWRCNVDKKKCHPGTPCRRCHDSRGKSNVPCRRDHVCHAVGVPFVCALSPDRPGLPRNPPRYPVHAALRPTCDFLDGMRKRRKTAIAAMKNADLSTARVRSHLIFFRVVNIQVPGIRKAEFDLLEQMELLNPSLELPYDEVIAKIVWEMEDNPQAKQVTGIESLEDLVGLLEAAAVCEAKSGHHEELRRLVFPSMCCLHHILEALRLSSHDLLIAKPHAYCAEANMCVSPGLRSLTKHVHRYTKALNTALFHKKKGKNNNWLLIFYSLCIQCYVRRVLMAIEARELDAKGPGIPRGGLESETYLRDAIFLFREMSLQSRGKLARTVRNSGAKPSLYLGQQQSNGSETKNTWEKWHEEGIVGYIGRIFDLTDYKPGDDSVQSRSRYRSQTGWGNYAEGGGSDSDDTLKATQTGTTAPTTTTLPAMTAPELVNTPTVSMHSNMNTNPPFMIGNTSNMDVNLESLGNMDAVTISNMSIGTMDNPGVNDMNNMHANSPQTMYGGATPNMDIGSIANMSGNAPSAEAAMGYCGSVYSPPSMYSRYSRTSYGADTASTTSTYHASGSATPTSSCDVSFVDSLDDGSFVETTPTMGPVLIPDDNLYYDFQYQPLP